MLKFEITSLPLSWDMKIATLKHIITVSFIQIQLLRHKKHHCFPPLSCMSYYYVYSTFYIHVIVIW